MLCFLGVSRSATAALAEAALRHGALVRHAGLSRRRVFSHA